MDQNALLYTLPQWFVFAAFLATVYGWVEKKKVFKLTGPVLLFIFGIYAAYSIYSGAFSAYHFLTPEEIISQEMGEELYEDIPFQARLLPAYWSFVAAALFAVPAFFFELKKKKPGGLFLILTGIAALLGFFIIVGELQNL